MKKIIALLLSIITIIICSWLILKNIDYLDIASNKTDWYTMDSKRKIDERIDIDFFEKQILKDRIYQSRNNSRIQSNMAFETQVFAFIIIIVQLVLLVFIIMMPSKLKNLV
ncbi:hypothetical protein [Paenimyroides baculatum]|uniref:Uncharacterized protein n=1 Tax=Paenimyroides baculatum TaxID=2608000 RepID=A0A5M6CPH4_9FLAO|nr:hypothetical protein [Paenimyroides baculatum]KAA5535882.1 hypothetical protein F0460_05440 [Paenimyroides baculatum]